MAYVYLVCPRWMCIVRDDNGSNFGKLLDTSIGNRECHLFKLVYEGEIVMNMKTMVKSNVSDLKNCAIEISWKYYDYGDDGITDVGKAIGNGNWEVAYERAICAWYDHGGPNNQGESECGWVANDLFALLTLIARKCGFESETTTALCWWLPAPRKGIRRLLFGA